MKVALYHTVFIKTADGKTVLIEMNTLTEPHTGRTLELVEATNLPKN